MARQKKDDDMDTVVIKNTTKHGLVLPLPCVRRPVKTGGTELVSMLSPGPNTVDAEVFGQIMEGYEREGRSDVKPNKTVKSWGDMGWLVVDEDEEEAVGFAESLESLNVGEAKEQIDGTNSAEVLERWRENEQRVTVLAALDARDKELAGDDSGGDD
jgi:hypothetical protein